MQTIYRGSDWDDPAALERRITLLSELTKKTWFRESYNPRFDYSNLWSRENDGSRTRHTKTLRTGENRVFVESKIAEARRQ
jgi:hypothetical protein